MVINEYESISLSFIVSASTLIEKSEKIRVALDMFADALNVKSDIMTETVCKCNFDHF